MLYELKQWLKRHCHNSLGEINYHYLMHLDTAYLVHCQESICIIRCTVCMSVSEYLFSAFQKPHSYWRNPT